MVDEVKEVLNEYGQAFEEFKKANDEKIEKLEKGLNVPVELNDKIENIEEKMNGLEDFNQRFTQAEKAQEQVNEKLSSLETILPFILFNFLYIRPEYTPIQLTQL